VTITNLGRPIDPRYPSNRTILGLGAIATAAAWFRWSTDQLWDSLLAAGLVGVLVVMAWAFTREIDPDRPTSATLAGASTLVVAMVVEGIAVLPMVGLLIAARILVRSTGKPPTVLDLIALIAGSFILGRTGAGWVAALVLAFATARDRTLPGLPTSRLARIAAPFLIAIIASISVALFSEEMWQPPAWWMIGLGVVGLLAGLFMPPYTPVSRCDLRGEPLEPRRLQSARRVALAGAVLISALGSIGLEPMLPVWLAFMAVWLTRSAPVPQFHPRCGTNPAEFP